MLTYPKKATIYTSQSTYDDYGAEAYTACPAFSSGVRLVTLSFKEEVRATGTVDGTRFFCYTRKNPNTLAVVNGDYLEVDGLVYEVIGIDPMHSKRSEIMFLVDLLQDQAVLPTNALMVSDVYFITSDGEYFIVEEAP